MRLISILLIVWLIPSEIYSQTLDVVINEISDMNELHGQYTGFYGDHSSQYKRYIKLKNESTYNQLVQLTNHSNAVVRCYAFWALADRKEEDLFTIVIDHINDTTTVNKVFADVENRTTVADFYIDLVTQDYISTVHYYIENRSQITSDEKSILDSLVLHSTTNLKYLDKLLETYVPDPKLYSRVRELAEQGNLYAFPALAKHQRTEDIELILSLKEVNRVPNMYPHPLEKLFQSIEEFPDEKFMSFLNEFGEKILIQQAQSRTWIYFYIAVAKYKNEEAFAILDRPFNTNQPISKYHFRFINYALGIYPDSTFDSIIIKLWSDHNQIAEGSFKHLKQQDDKLTYRLISSYLEDFEEVNSGAGEYLMLPVILPFALQFNKERTVNLIANNLRKVSVTPFRKFFPFVITLKSPEFIEPLFDRIENEWNGHVVYLAVEILASYDDEYINDQILFKSSMNFNILNEYTSQNEVENTIRDIINGESWYEKYFKDR